MRLPSNENAQVRHFIAYHNTEKMGRSLSEGDPLSLLTNKPVAHLCGNVVWFIVGEGSNSRTFSLGSVFRVSEVGEADDARFKHFASGLGHVFQPPVSLDSVEWFPTLKKAVSNFSLGVQEVKDKLVITGLTELASRTGYNIG